mgnify:CR=1 FL=1
MDIIEAIQQAESGKLITNNFLKINDYFLKYIKNGVFAQYKIINKKAVYCYEVRNFSYAECISIGWEVLTENYFINEN